MKQAFIKTTDKETVDKLLSSGFVLISQDSQIYTFLNEPSKKLNFDVVDAKKIVYDNKLSL